MRVLIVGCGYVGIRVGRELVSKGHEVTGICRSRDRQRELEAAGISLVLMDVTRPDVWRAMNAPYDWILFAASSSRGGGVPKARAIFLEATGSLVAHLADRPPAKYLHITSTRVYGQTDGSWVTERSACTPPGGTGRILLAAERLVREAHQAKGLPAIVIRPSGIYGPGRSSLIHRFLASEPLNPKEGLRFMNRIHRDDLVSAIIRIFEAGKIGEIYNVSDDEPVTRITLFRWLSRRLDRPMPPAEPGSGEAGGTRAITNKRVSNAKLKNALKFKLRYPTFREGLSVELDRLGLV